MESQSSPLVNDEANESNNQIFKDPDYPGKSAPQISLPKGGASTKSIEDKFPINVANSIADYINTLLFSPSRNGINGFFGHPSGCANLFLLPVQTLQVIRHNLMNQLMKHTC